ncbi:Fic family protein [Brevibacterium linens]|uniref:Fic family protein n=1 Tax=Brevibacterium linens TaxID=1703 RepID=UPI0019D06F6E
MGRERGDALGAVIGAIYQGFGDHELYPTVEEKAAHLLYFVVKDHPLSDGNKSAAPRRCSSPSLTATAR